MGGASLLFLLKACRMKSHVTSEALVFAIRCLLYFMVISLNCGFDDAFEWKRYPSSLSIRVECSSFGKQISDKQTDEYADGSRVITSVDPNLIRRVSVSSEGTWTLMPLMLLVLLPVYLLVFAHCFLFSLSFYFRCSNANACVVRVLCFRTFKDHIFVLFVHFPPYLHFSSKCLPSDLICRESSKEPGHQGVAKQTRPHLG